MNSEVELISGVIKGGFPPAELPAPRLIKIFISANYGEFESERRELLEYVGPELQTIYEDMGIEVLLIDVQYGIGRNIFLEDEYNECFLKEIAAAKKHSRGCFMIAFLDENNRKKNEDEDDIPMNIVEKHLEHALKLDPKGDAILLLHSPLHESTAHRSQLNEENIIKLEENWRENVLSRLQSLANTDIEAKPELKSRKRLVQEVYAESLCHLSILRGVDPISEEADEMKGIKSVLDKLEQSLEEGRTKAHPPIIIQGAQNTLKTRLLSTIYRNSSETLSKPFKIVRMVGKTPRSTYSLELLRSLCQHLGFLCGNYDGNLSKEISFEPLYLNNWWNNILRHFEKNRTQEDILILIDDLDRLRMLENDIVAALVWLPVSLPPGIHLVITITHSINTLKLTPAQKSRLDSEEIILQLQERSREDWRPRVNELLQTIGDRAATKLGCILSVTEFGLSETEILEILMPTDKEGSLNLEKGEFNFATWCFARWRFAHLLQIRVMSGRLLTSFPLSLRDYFLVNRETIISTHKQISEIFFGDTQQFREELQSPESNSQVCVKERPFNTKKVTKCLTYNVRHIEEAWLHLLFAENTKKLKEYVVCAFDFLLAAVQMISISYLRCVLENVRRYFLERDVELVYFAIRKSSDVLTKEPIQLAAQLISWLRSVAEDSEDMVSQLITSAMAWCDGYTAPLLVPLNPWLQQPLPLQVRSLNIAQSIKLISPGPIRQLIIVVPTNGDPQVRHIVSGQLLSTLKGHSAPVTCITTSSEPDLVFTGSEDTTIIVWDLKTLSVVRRIQEHFATVLCLAYSKKNNLILSGGEDSRIIAYDLTLGSPKIRIDHHRGPITALATDTSEEVLVCSSSDKTISFFCLNNFSLLNTLTLSSPICNLKISTNSVFLLVFCADNRLYLRSLATGTEIHQLKGSNEKIRSLEIAYDSKRAICGTDDGKILVFDMNSGRLVRSLMAGGAAIESLYVIAKDDFLVCAGGGKVTFWSFRCEESLQKQRNSSKSAAMNEHTSAINCLTISRDGTMVATGGVDSMVNLWQLNSCELISSFEGHIASVTCVDFGVSGLFIASGSEDKTVRVWGLTLGLVVATFRHQAPVTSVKTLMDARRIVSSDRSGCIRIWAADTAVLLQSIPGPGNCLAISNDMRYLICGTGDNTLRILSINSNSEEHIVSHTQEITCLTLTPDSQLLITGSRDMSLKIWQLCGGKLSQVLVGHTDHVTCVAVSLCDRSKVVSGSRDANVIIWDINTGADLFTLQGHNGCVTCVRVSDDGSVCVTGSEDKSLMLWDTKKGSCLSSISLHVPVLGVEMASDCSRIALFLLEHRCMPILCLHNTPVQYIKVPIIQSSKEIRVQGTKRPVRRLLKKEVSLDTYTWQRKYGHLTSGLPISEESLKRRFSVSASMEEISKSGLETEPKEAGLEQSRHFDQLEAIWNMQRPSNRRLLQKQGSLRECRIEDSEEEELPD